MMTVQFAAFILLLLLSVPIVVAMAVATIIPPVFDAKFPMGMEYILRSLVSGVDSTPLLAIPLFVLSGAIMAAGGISKRLFDLAAYVIGRRTGGMPMAVVLTCLFYGAISGSGPATCAAVGAMTIPLLVSLGYGRVFSAALVASASGLGIIIPPSIPFILWGLATDASVGSLFIAGIIPGILIALALMIFVYAYCRIRGEDKERIAANCEELRRKGFVRVFLESIWALLAPVIILGGIYSGIITPTEAAGVSVLYALIVALFIYRTIRFGDIGRILSETVFSYAPILALIAVSFAFSRVLTLVGAPTALASFLLDNFESKVAFLLVLNLVLIVLGMFIDVGPAILIIGPLLMPIANAFGVDIVHLGVIVTINLAIGFVSPPFGLNLFVAGSLSKEPVLSIGRMAIPFALCIIAVLLLVTYVPWIALGLI